MTVTSDALAFVVPPQCVASNTAPDGQNGNCHCQSGECACDFAFGDATSTSTEVTVQVQPNCTLGSHTEWWFKVECPH